MISIIPVLDLMNGQVVQAIKGEREQYRPVTSLLTPLSEPVRVAQALAAVARSGVLYAADLDAITGRANNSPALRRMATVLPCDLWLDAGANDPDAALRLLAQGATHVVIGSETLSDECMLPVLAAGIPADRVVFSLDLRHGQVLSRSSRLAGMPPLDVLALVADLGWQRAIVLSLDRVGTGCGPGQSLLLAARERFPSLYLVAGGGIRAVADLQRLDAAGIDAALIATALHQGWITRDELDRLSRDE